MGNRRVKQGLFKLDGMKAKNLRSIGFEARKGDAILTTRVKGVGDIPTARFNPRKKRF